MSDTPVQVTTKNPKKVEADKRLAEFNRKNREEYKRLLMAQTELQSAPQTQTQPAPQTHSAPQTQLEDPKDIVIEDSVTDGPKHGGVNYTIMGGGVIVMLLIGALVVYKNKDKNIRVKGTPPSNSGNKKTMRISKLEME
ncbi:uncharacterized protein LOC130647884 [Hydractinia symbiolongicarpus]|uniref:uncharacterized protein LOC130647884 n=1 Tax=Hydractinia symbiolongicarpus TaxID=13093 RepID=UPI002550B594|nr:uncharacterized protein LOC130647884 [Hydractinia symbiolongicarpus]